MADFLKIVPDNNPTARMFKSDWIEPFSRVHPITPLVVFVPLISYFIYRSIFLLNVSVGLTLGLIALGFFAWTFTEYTLHRFVFHYPLKGKIGERIHFIFHGVHHEHPRDAWRLVMPPSISLPLAALFYYLFVGLTGAQWASALFAGFASGYLTYDTMHFALHHYNFKAAWWKKLKLHHMKHHYQDDHNGYGVSTALWDYVFGTHRFKEKEKKGA